MAGIPGIRPSKFYEKKWFAEIISVVPTLIVMSVTALSNFADPSKVKFGYALLAAIVWTICSTIVKFLQAKKQDNEEKSKQSYEGLLGTLHILYGTIIRTENFNPQEDVGKLRVTIYRVIMPPSSDESPKEIEQMIPYVGSKGGPPSRKCSIRSGITGQAVREKSPIVAYRENDNYEQYVKELVSKWSFPEDEARKLSIDKYSFMAVPIFGKQQEVIAVVYLDSIEKNFFQKATKTYIIHACEAIAEFIKETYK